MDGKLLNLKKILSKPQESRDAIDINQISAYVSNVKFFESLKEQKSIFKECCTYLQYEFVPANSYVFKAGDFGDRFYVLLKGDAGVIITIKEKEAVVSKEVLVYHDGGSFGELALTGDKPRAASILAKTDCHFAVLDKFNYNRILSSIIIKKRNELVEFLQCQSMFKSITKGSLMKLSYCFDEKTYKKGQVLFKEGQVNEHLYLIRDGEIQLSQYLRIDMTNSDDLIAKNMISLKKFVIKKVDIGILGVGEMLGLNDLEGKCYSNTCVCFSKSAKVLVISLVNFKRRINNQESLNVIKDGTLLRNLLHQDSIKSVTKVMKERVSSPLKRFIMSGGVQSEEPELEDEIKEVDVVEKDTRPKRKMYDQIIITRPVSKKKLISDQSWVDKRSSLSKIKIFEKVNTGKSIEIKKSSEDCDRKKKHSDGKVLKNLIKKIKPFGKRRIFLSPSKEEKVVNIHRSSLRYNTPKSCSFRSDLIIRNASRSSKAKTVKAFCF